MIYRLHPEAAHELEEKLAQITRIGRAIDCAKDQLEADPSASGALMLQKLQQEQQELRGTLPRPRLVYSA